MAISWSELLLRLGVATLLGALLGWEREVNVHNAGLRTNTLVAVGSALFTIVSAYGFLAFTKYQHIQIDPTRIASYVVAGIGFLGGGTIFLRRDANQVRGLTSAATIWMVAAVGMACGAGLYSLAIVATLLALFILIGLRYIEAYWLSGRSQHQRVLKIRFQSQEDDGEVIGKIYGILNNNHADIETMQILKEANQDCVLNVHCHILQDKDLTLVVNDLRMLHNVKEVEVALRKGALTGDADV
jgi:putative Mg2+ transporter-C (MgtC) family protein